MAATAVRAFRRGKLTSSPPQLFGRQLQARTFILLSDGPEHTGKQLRTHLHPRDRLPYSPIATRPALKLPAGVRFVLWPLLALEEWDLSRPMARMVITPPQGQPQIPDLPNWSWHEYGMRVGFWRLKKMFERLGVSPTVTLNAKVCETYPQVVEACMANRWELNAHSYDQIPMHKVDDQRAVIKRSMDIIERFSGKRPRGWFGPGLTQTLDTPDFLSEAGVEYIGDWVLDDEPVTLKTKHRPLVALPYNFEIHDIVMMALQNHPSDMIYRRALDQFECLYAESAERPKIMCIACHPYLSGAPHRLRHVEQAFREILGHGGVVAWDGEKILDWYLAQTAAPAA